MGRRDLEADEVADLVHGRPVPAGDATEGTVALVRAGRLVGIGEVDGAMIRPRKVFPA